VSKIGALRDLLAEHERDGLGAAEARFLFYELVQRGQLSKERKGARRPNQMCTTRLPTCARMGASPGIGSSMRPARLSATLAMRLSSSVLEQLRCITLDQWRRQAPLVLTESRSLAGVLRSVANEYRVCIAATNGQCGGFLRTGIAPELRPDDRVVDLEAAQLAAVD
jgi:hypothetical protein